MPLRNIRRMLPSQSSLRARGALPGLSRWLGDEALWRFQRRRVVLGFALGLFVAWIPLPMQMLIAAVLAVLFRLNLPVAVGAVWLTNPLTAVPMFYAAFRLGQWILTDHLPVATEPDWHGLWEIIEHAWEPFLLGCLVLGSVSALLGFLLINTLYWISVRRATRRRTARKADKAQGKLR